MSIMKECKICKLIIDTSKEHHMILKEVDNNIQQSKSYYHAQCFGDKLLVQRQMVGALGNLNSLINSAKGMVKN